MNKIRKGDEVIVLAGRDKGKRGTVVLRKDDEHLVALDIHRDVDLGGLGVPGRIG